MKPTITFLLAVSLALLLLTACQSENAPTPPATDPAPAQSQPDSPQSPPEPHPDEPVAGPAIPEDTAEEDLQKQLGDELKNQGYNDEEIQQFQSNYTYTDLDTHECYRSDGLMGHNTLLVRQKETTDFQSVDLADWSTLPILSVYLDYENPDNLAIVNDGYYFGGDYAFKNFNSLIHYSLSEETIVNVEYLPTSGVYGMTPSWDFQSFDPPVFQGNRVVLSTHFRSGGMGNEFDGGEVHISLPTANENRYVFAFKNTPNTLGSEFLEQMANLPGVKDVSLGEVNSHLFSGTEISFVLEDGYRCEPYFNRSGEVASYEDLTLEFVQEQPEMVEGIS